MRRHVVLLVCAGVAATIGLVPQAAGAPSPGVHVKLSGGTGGGDNNALMQDVVTLSADGNTAVYTLVQGTTSTTYIHDLTTGTSTPFPAGPVTDGDLSADGRYLAFTSSRSDLVAGDTNNRSDVLRADLRTGTILRASLQHNGAQFPVAASGKPSISDDGRYVGFVSTGGAPFGDCVTSRAYRRDVTGNATKQVSTCVVDAELSGNGAFMALTTTSNTVARSGVARYSFASSTATPVAADGGEVSISGNGRVLVWGSATAEQEILAYDAVTGATERVDVNDAGDAADLATHYVGYDPQVNGNGRLVTFTSRATNLGATADTDDEVDVFVRDRAAGTTREITLGTGPTTGASFWPAISGSGDEVVYVTQSDHLDGSPDGRADVYATGYAASACATSTANEVAGTPGDDTLNGTYAADVIYGLGGSDTIAGWGGNDLLCGGAGNDVLLGEQGADELWGGTGEDYLGGGQSGDQLRGDSGDDYFVGEGTPLHPGRGDTVNPGLDTFRGDAGRDTFVGTQKTEQVFGGAGSDLFTLHTPFAAGTSLQGNLFGEGGDDVYDICPQLGAGVPYTGSTGSFFLNGGAGADSALGIPSNYQFKAAGTVETFAPCT